MLDHYLAPYYLESPELSLMPIFSLKLFTFYSINEFCVIYLKLLKKKYFRIHSLFTKFIQNNMIFNYISTKSNLFMNFIKSNRILLQRSLGLIGFRKKKKKIQTHSTYLLGTDFCDRFKKLLFKNRFRRVIVQIKGFKRFIKSSFSQTFYHLRYLGRFLFNKVKSSRKWYSRKRNIIRKCQRKEIEFRPTARHRRIEIKIMKDIVKGLRQRTRLLFVRYLGSFTFGYQKFAKVNLFAKYIKRRFF